MSSSANMSVQEGLFYSKSDEKFTVRSLLDEIFGNATFDRALDVGPGSGHITEPLARRTRQLVLVERAPQYEEILRNQFPTAKIFVSSFADTQLTGTFDAILFSHVLYYHQPDVWLPYCKRLVDLLSDKGELLVILNSDAGDWWKIMSQFRPTLGEHIGFHYKPLSQFKRELAEIAHVQPVPYRFQIWIEPGAWCEFIGKQILEIADEAVLKQNADSFAQFAKQFKQVDGSIVMDFRGEILRLTKCQK